MEQELVFLGSFPEDGTGDGLEEGGGKINRNFTKLFALPIIGKATSSINNPISTTSDTFVATGGTVSLDTKLTTSKLKLSFSGICTLQVNELEAEFELSYSIDNGETYTEVLIAAFEVESATPALAINKTTLANSIIIDSPVTLNTVIVNLNWRGAVSGAEIDLQGTSNLLEIEEFQQL